MKKRLLATVLAGAGFIRQHVATVMPTKQNPQQHPKQRMLQQKPEQKAVKHRQLLRTAMQALS